MAILLLAFVFIITTNSAEASARKTAKVGDRHASIVIDAATGEVLQAANPDKQVYPASLTKMMTLFILFDELERGHVRLDQRLAVSRHAAGQAPSKLGLQAGETISVQDAILGLVTKSANDVAVVVAEAIGGTEPQFATMMTNRARELGMVRTTFRNASGLPNKDQLTSARDMATLARALVRQHSRYYAYFSTERFTFRDQQVSTHNHLLGRYDGADGIKTGYINASGFNLVASARRDGRRLIGVVFGGNTAAARDREMVRLLDEGFETKHGKPTPVMTASSVPAAPAPAAASDEEADEQVAAANIVGSGDAEDAGWAIQIGAYSQRKAATSAARQATSKLRSLLADAHPAVIPHATAKGTLYRARLTGLTEDAARSACKRLASSKNGCQVLAPEEAPKKVSRR